MGQKYERAVTSVVAFAADDIITTSGEPPKVERPGVNLPPVWFG